MACLALPLTAMRKAQSVQGAYPISLQGVPTHRITQRLAHAARMAARLKAGDLYHPCHAVSMQRWSGNLCPVEIKFRIDCDHLSLGSRAEVTP